MELKEIFDKMQEEYDKRAEESSKPLHILITNKETGEVLVDSDTNCIIGSYLDGKKSASMGFTHCNVLDLLFGIKAAQSVIKTISSDNVFLKGLLALTKED